VGGLPSVLRYFKDPQDARWADDPAVKEYRDALTKYAPKSDPEDAFNMYGWTVANTMAKAN
jgi:branched-chain amino acid transport system substrate-binding protein